MTSISPTGALDADSVLELSDGSVLPLILEHYLTYPQSYEIPLRTMYSLNCTSRSMQPLSPPSPNSPKSAFAAPPPPQAAPMDPASQFKAQLISQIARLGSQPCTLPTTFITTFLRRCFVPELHQVDFPQALTGLDYLKDLETRRRREVASALQRLDITRGDLQQKLQLKKKYPGVLGWVESLDAKELKIEALYTQVYVGLRRWILINEMLLEPYNKANCLAMLNTLFPPMQADNAPPTSKLTPKILQAQRDGFFRYINSIESDGKQILKPVMQQGAREGESSAWPLIAEALDKYLTAAVDILDECAEITGSDRNPFAPESSHKRQPGSGTSFGSSERSFASSATDKSDGLADKPLPPSPEGRSRKTSGSTLEKIAQELRKMRIRPESPDGSRFSRKKSSANLSVSRQQSVSSGGDASEHSSFQIDNVKRNRLVREARKKKVAGAADDQSRFIVD